MTRNALFALTIFVLSACDNGDVTSRAEAFAKKQFPGAEVGVSCITGGCDDNWIPCTATVRYPDQKVPVTYTMKCTGGGNYRKTGCYVERSQGTSGN